MAVINWWDGLHSVVLLFCALCWTLLSWTDCRLSCLPTGALHPALSFNCDTHTHTRSCCCTFLYVLLLKYRMRRFCLQFVCQFLCCDTRAHTYIHTYVRKYIVHWHTHTGTRTHIHTQTHRHTHHHHHCQATDDIGCLVGSNGVKFRRHLHCKVFFSLYWWHVKFSGIQKEVMHVCQSMWHCPRWTKMYNVRNFTNARVWNL